MNINSGNPLGPTVEGGEINIPGATTGDLLEYNGTTWTRLTTGATAGTVLTSAGAAANPAWQVISGAVPVGTVVAWLKTLTGTPALPSNWCECAGQTISDATSPYNGQVIPDLNAQAGTARFLRGATSSGGTGGTEVHSHSTGTTQSTGIGGTSVATPNTNDASTLPSYYGVVWVIRFK